MNIAIMRTFVKMRQWILNSQEFANKLQAFETKLEEHGTAIEAFFETFDQFSEEKEAPPRVLIGFKK